MQTKNNARYLLFFLLYLCLFTIALVYTLCEKFKIYTFEQILFHLTQPMGTTGPVFIKKIALNTSIESIVMFLLALFIMAFIHYKTSKYAGKFTLKYIFSIDSPAYTKVLSIGLAACLVFMLFFIMVKLKGFEYIKQALTPASTFYEKNYVYPDEKNISFPRKKNLIIIHLESYEKTYFNREIFKNDLLPNIAGLCASELSFDGYRQVSGTEWTIGGLFSAYCGVPLKVVIAGNDYGRFKSFFSNILCLPQILKNNGYRTYYLQGADLKFAGKDKFFSQHGFDEIYGWDEFKARKDYRNSYNAYWSVNDKALFEYTKQKLLEVSKQKGPFFLSMLTADSHSPDCFLSGACEKKFKIKLENVLACTDAMTGEFVEWAKKQEFYRDTTIVILGDHLTMRNELSDKLEPVKNRELVNIFINSAKETKNTARVYAMFDLMPTIIESMGGRIAGGRLGLGTSLFSGQKTLIEQEDFDSFNEHIYAKSKLYESFR